MDKLSRWMIPYASDYTGVAASLYDLDGMAVFCDAGCCTDHYVLNDEPRWRQRPGLCFSTHLRSTEAVLGSDRALVERVCAYIGEVGRPLPLVAVLGTPVPGILGTDVEGIAAEIEARAGIPALGFATTGFKTYDHGIEIAMKALVERFGPEGAPATVEPRRINILGATPLDFGDVGNDRDFAALFEDAGWTVGLQMPMGAAVDAIAQVADAALNVAVSAAGLRTARWLERRYGTPWVAGCPLGSPDGAVNRAILAACEAVAGGARPSGWWRDAHADGDRSRCEQAPTDGEHDRQEQVLAGTEQTDQEQAPTLVIADQVVAESVRAHLEEKHPRTPVVVASPFAWDRGHAGSRDFAVRSEEDLVAQAAALRPGAIVADPTLEFLALGQPGCSFAPLVHGAVSGKLHWDDATRLSGL